MSMNTAATGVEMLVLALVLLLPCMHALHDNQMAVLVEQPQERLGLDTQRPRFTCRATPRHRATSCSTYS